MIISPKEQKRHLRLVKINPGVLVDLLKGWGRIGKPYLPEDTEFVDMNYDSEGQVVNLIVSSESYPILFAGHVVPEINLNEQPVINRIPDEDKEND